MESAFEKWYEANYRKIAATSSWPERARQTWDAALEEAAKVARRPDLDNALEIADAIRELKEQK